MLQLRKLKQFLVWAHFDRAVAFSVLVKMWGLISGPVTIFLIASRFKPVVQGYYYTFNSLLALQVFVELGLGYVLTQFASHEWSHLEVNQQGLVVGKHEAMSRLSGLVRFSMRWYAVASLVLSLGLVVGGSVFFSKPSNVDVRWFAPWICLCVLSSAKLCLLPIMSILEGCHQVKQVYQCRLAESVAMTFALWSVIILGGGLWSASASIFAGFVCTSLYLYIRYKQFFSSILNAAVTTQIDFKREVWPMQWRIAISWMCGYFTFSLFTPILFYYQGAVVAGQMGMTWSLVSALSAIASSFVYTKAPAFGSLAARSDFSMLDSLFYRTMTASVVAAVLGGCVIELAVIVINQLQMPLSNRLLGPLPTALLLVATIVLQISFAQSTYLRAHKQEPFLVISILSGVVVGGLSLFFAKYWGATGVAAAYLGSSLIITIPLGTLIWFRCRSSWHGVPQEIS